MSVKDILGMKVKVNDWVAVSFRRGNHAELRVGKVIGFGRRTLYGNEVPTMAIEWIVSSGYSLPKGPTSIDSSGAKFVIIPNPEEN